MPRLVSHPDEVKIVTRRFGMGAAEIDKYIELGGYDAAKKCLAQGPEWIISEMKSSNLRGRGGAGFPTGLKWSFVPKQSAKPKYVLVNGDESEPGTCKDHLIFLHDPHAVIEGAMIAGLAIGAKIGFIYLRGEYRYLLKIMEKAVADAYAKGFLGKNIFGSDTEFQIITQTGAGAYEVGEESALMESLEGKRGVPRIKPPFPAVVGLYGGPTVINNAETIAKDRAHVHFELNVLLNDNFAAWFKTTSPGERNDHGEWNGLNLNGLDPLQILMGEKPGAKKFSLLDFVRSQTELCRVLVRDTNFPYLKRYPQLVLKNPVTEKEGVAGYELVLNYNGVPFALMPRAASEIKGTAKFQLVSVNAAEALANPCRKLVVQRGGRWQLGDAGLRELQLLTY